MKPTIPISAMRELLHIYVETNTSPTPKTTGDFLRDEGYIIDVPDIEDGDAEISICSPDTRPILTRKGEAYVYGLFSVPEPIKVIQWIILKP